jgi:hypothetical protein
MVAFGYWFASRRSSPPLLEVVVVGFGSMLSFWAVSRLSWWQSVDITLSSWFLRVRDSRGAEG